MDYCLDSILLVNSRICLYFKDCKLGVILDSVFHFVKHALGFCGEPHPSLLMGGFGIIGYCVYCIKVFKNKLRRK